MKDFQKHKPWEHQEYTITKYEKYRRGPNYNLTYSGYDATFETLKSYDRSYWKLGDIIKFNSGYQKWRIKDRWEAWFTKGKEYKKFIIEHCPRDRKIPYYADNQYAIILGRYKWVKYKYYKTFRDYGSIIMMLTGSNIGYARKYFVIHPFKKIGKYPYTKLRYRLNRKKLFCDVEIGNDVKEFLKNITEKIAYESH